MYLHHHHSPGVLSLNSAVKIAVSPALARLLLPRLAREQVRQALPRQPVQNLALGHSTMEDPTRLVSLPGAMIFETLSSPSQPFTCWCLEQRHRQKSCHHSLECLSTEKEADTS